MMHFQNMCLSMFGMIIISAIYANELIITERKVTAKLGENVSLKCELRSKSKDVLQITWQKTKGKLYENIATYNKRFGINIANVFRDRVNVTQMETYASSITIRGIRKQDESCYNCIFNAYPEGAITGKTCLSVYGTTKSVNTTKNTKVTVASNGPTIYPNNNYTLKCTMPDPNVKQITWRKEDKLETMITYNDTDISSIDIFEKVLEDYDQRLIFSVRKYWNLTEFESTNSKRYVLYDSSIIIHNVQFEDEGCYICSFNVYTQGTINGRSCLTVIDYTRITVDNPRPTIVLNQNATLECILPEPNVTQFIWWKEDKLEDNLERIVSYNLTSYDNVTSETKDLELYDQRLTFAMLDEDVPTSSIIIHNVQLEDEGCYVCSFKLYPQGKINGRVCLTVIGIVEINIEKFSTQSEDIIMVSCSVVGKPGPMVRWKTSENVIEHKAEIKEDDNGIVTVISNVTVDLSTFQANKITCIASQLSQDGQTLEKTISLREVRNVPFRIAIVVGIFVTLLIIVTVIAIRSGRILPAVCFASTTRLSLSSLLHGVVSERQGPRRGD